MNILAFDSSTRVAAVAVAEDEKILSSFTVDSGMTQSELLLPLARKALEAAHLSFSDIGLFAVTVGPGSFTGVRIGTSLIKGLAFGRDIPCAPVSVMEVLADNLFPLDGLYCPVCDARRGQVYNALFCKKDGTLTRLTPDRLIPAKDLLSELSEQYNDIPVRLCGDATETVTRLAAEVAPRLILSPTPPALLLSNGGAVARRGLACYKRGEAVSDLSLAPVYLRPCQAERERLEKEQHAKEIM
ncbi:MAG: tRNA (adenosine(37)-N6)-threonylcarbamoyltransferase complex dimerization subunit type 1 TsaB [Clostridia bacterium]|nr:tRNA (adenosine(37)-N6)-threonylcarbamoyltransferase complex dimerization subunit type 1 TsaB [Clostridia bacterium]